MSVQSAIDRAKKWTAAEADWMYRNIRIIGRNKKLEPFRLNSLQLKLALHLNTQKAMGLPVRAYLLKARKIGFSTYTEARFYMHAVVQPYIEGLVVAHDSDSTEKLFRMTQLMHNNLPRNERRPTVNVSGREIRFASPWNSSIQLMTAGGKEKARGFDPNRLHGSEYHFWPNETIFLGMLAAVGESPDTEIILESTANGAAGESYQRWIDSVERKRLSPNDWRGYEPLFFSWLDVPWYRQDVPAGYDFGKLDEDEWGLREMGADPEQLYWRRIKLADVCGGDAGKFKQEYPATSEEAFRYAGSQVISADILGHHRSTVRKGQELQPRKYRLEWASGNKDSVIAIPVAESEMIGIWTIWREPKPGDEFIIGADIAEGIQSDPDNQYSERDWSAAAVRNRREHTYDATYRGRCEPDVFGEELLKAAIYFNRAWIAPEANSVGLATLARIREYPKVFRREGNFEDVAPQPLEKLGWKTTQNSRPLLIAEWITSCCREPMVGFDEKVQVWDPMCLSEENTFIRDKNGKCQHKPGAHDDMLFAHMIANIAHLRIPFQKEFRPWKSQGHVTRMEDLAYAGARDPGWDAFDVKNTGRIQVYWR